MWNNKADVTAKSFQNSHKHAETKCRFDVLFVFQFFPRVSLRLERAWSKKIYYSIVIMMARCFPRTPSRPGRFLRVIADQIMPGAKVNLLKKKARWPERQKHRFAFESTRGVLQVLEIPGGEKFHFVQIKVAWGVAVALCSDLWRFSHDTRQRLPRCSVCLNWFGEVFPLIFFNVQIVLWTFSNARTVFHGLHGGPLKELFWGLVFCVFSKPNLKRNVQIIFWEIIPEQCFDKSRWPDKPHIHFFGQPSAGWIRGRVEYHEKIHWGL